MVVATLVAKAVYAAAVITSMASTPLPAVTPDAGSPVSSEPSPAKDVATTSSALMSANVFVSVNQALV